MSHPCAATASSPVILISIAPSLREGIDAALLRLGYLHPTLSFQRDADGIVVEGSMEEEGAIRREVLHAVYRERILERTISMRRSLIEGLMAS